MSNKVVLLADHKKEYESIRLETGTGSVYPGFSARMNELLDRTGIVPPLDNGRITYITELTGCTRQIVNAWLTKDKPPRDNKDQDKKTSLITLVSYFNKYLNTDASLYRIVAWLRYGEEATDSPFKQVGSLDNDQLIPIAVKVIVDVAKQAGISTSSFDLDTVLDETRVLLSDFSIMSYEDILPAHRRIILQYIRSSRL